MANVIFVAGLDNRKNPPPTNPSAKDPKEPWSGGGGTLVDETLEKQTAHVKKGFGKTADIKDFRFNASINDIKKAITDNTTAQILLFSAGCAKTLAIAQHMISLKIPLSNLFVNEPYSVSSGVKKGIDDAIALGLPASNVFCGTKSDANGANIKGHTDTSAVKVQVDGKEITRTSHNQSLEVVAKIMFDKAGNPPQTTGSSGTSGNAGSAGSSGNAGANASSGNAGSAGIAGSSGSSGIVQDPNAVRLTLKKESGPGEIIGLIEQEAKDNKVVFSGIQFSEPGQYIVSVVPSSPEIQSTSFSISIQSQDEPIGQTVSGLSQSESGNRPIIAQIDQPTIKVEPIKLDVVSTKRDESDVTTNKEMVTNYGFKPLVSYNGTPIKEGHIRGLSLYYEGIVPACHLEFEDSYGLIGSEDTRPLADTKFDLFLTSNSKFIKPIHIKFKIEEYDSSKKDNSIQLTGMIDLPDFYKQNGKSYQGTSFEALRTLSKEYSVGFNSNINNTDDAMIWKSNQMLPIKFMKQIMEHSYISDDSFVTGYIDYYYCFNYIDVEKEWTRDIKNDVMIDSTSVAGGLSPAGKNDPIPLRLTNDFSNSQSSSYIARWSVKNNATAIARKAGQFIKSMVYDRLSKTFQVFDVNSMTTKGSDNIVMKGAPLDDKEHKTNYRHQFSGFIDTENTHKNYLYAKSQNKVNFDNLRRIEAELELPNPNFNLYRYQKVQIDFIVQKQTVNEPKQVDERLTGEWMILNIRYEWKKGSLCQFLDVCRKEYSKTAKEKADQKNKKDNQNNNEKNENPTAGTPSTTKPNEFYEEGKEYTIKDANGKNYIIIVKKRLENGNEISATIAAQDGSGLPPRINGSVSTAQEATGDTGKSAEIKDSEVLNYDVVVENPKTPAHDKVKGDITVNKVDGKYGATGNFSNFPLGVSNDNAQTITGTGSIGPLKIEATGTDKNAVVTQMLLNLESEVKRLVGTESGKKSGLYYGDKFVLTTKEKTPTTTTTVVASSGSSGSSGQASSAGLAGSSGQVGSSGSSGSSGLTVVSSTTTNGSSGQDNKNLDSDTCGYLYTCKMRGATTDDDKKIVAKVTWYTKSARDDYKRRFGISGTGLYDQRVETAKNYAEIEVVLPDTPNRTGDIYVTDDIIGKRAFLTPKTDIDDATKELLDFTTKEIYTYLNVQIPFVVESKEKYN